MSETVQRITGDAFQEEVVHADRPVVVDFYADWCGPCRMLSPVMDRLSQEYAGKVKFVKINTDENQDLATKFGIVSIPTVMFFSKGKVDDIVVGVAPAAQFKKKIDALVAS